MQAATAISVIEIRPLSGDKPLKGFADVKVGDWVVRDWRIVKQEGKPLQVMPPQVSWRGQLGRIVYKTIVTLPDELKGQVDLAILQRFTEEMEKTDAQSRPQK